MFSFFFSLNAKEVPSTCILWGNASFLGIVKVYKIYSFEVLM